jgi:ubiquinone biosynthesis protein
MTPRAFQIDPQELAAIVPNCYAEFRPLVAEGLTFFLQHLSPARLAEVMQAQAELPADANLSRRLATFLLACPVLHKLGQVVARNRNLDPELRRHLQELESLEPHTPVEQWRPMLACQLGPAAEEYRIQAAERPLAEGSVAVVVPLLWSDPARGEDAPRQHGVAKLLRPGVVERLDEDLRILDQLAGYLEERWAAYGLPPLAYREVLGEVAELLTQEVRLRQEQAHLALAAIQCAGLPDVQVPRLLPFCTDALTAMERVYGRKVTDAPASAAWQRPALFYSTVRALVSGVWFSREASVLFHGDPHGGNLLATRDGRLAILDWSLAGQLTLEDRAQLVQVMVGGWSRDAARVAGAVAALAHAAGQDLIRPLMDKALAELPWFKLPGPNWALELFDALARAGVRFPPRLLLFRKAYLTLQGVLADLSPYCSLEATLVAEALVQLAWEWPKRWWKPLDNRDYATHLSSADLLVLALRQGCRFRLPAMGN